MEDEAFDFKAIVRVWNSHYKWEGRKNKKNRTKKKTYYLSCRRYFE